MRCLAKSPKNCCLVLLLLCLGAINNAQAQTLDAEAAGFFFDTGQGGGTGVDEYRAGFLNLGLFITASRNYFVFDLSGLSGQTITSANLELYNRLSGYLSPDPSETFALFSVSSAPSDLTIPRSPGDATGLALFSDLGQGDIYGSVDVTESDEGLFVTVSLNATGLAALQASVGGDFAMGGALTTIPDPPAGPSQLAFVQFIGADPNPFVARLVIETAPQAPPAQDIPILSGWGLILIAVVLVAAGIMRLQA